MAHRSNSDGSNRLPVLERCAVIVLGLYLAGVGLNAIGTGNWMYANYLRAPVAAPVAIVVGLVFIVVGLVIRR